MIQLERLNMHRVYSSKVVSGEIELQGDIGTVKLSLTPEVCAKIVELVADQIVTVVKELATNMSVEALGVSALIENKE